MDVRITDTRCGMGRTTTTTTKDEVGAIVAALRRRWRAGDRGPTATARKIHRSTMASRTPEQELIVGRGASREPDA